LLAAVAILGFAVVGLDHYVLGSPGLDDLNGVRISCR
jgi:hypothetical protein